MEISAQLFRRTRRLPFAAENETGRIANALEVEKGGHTRPLHSLEFATKPYP